MLRPSRSARARSAAAWSSVRRRVIAIDRNGITLIPTPYRTTLAVVVDRRGRGELDVGRPGQRGEVVLLATAPEQRHRLVAGVADDLIVGVERFGDRAVWAVGAAEVGHLAVLPQERVQRRVVRRRCQAYDVPGGVDVEGEPEVAAEGAEVAQARAVPQERVDELVARKRSEPDDLAGVVDPVGLAERAAEAAEVSHLAARPQVRMQGRD